MRVIKSDTGFLVYQKIFKQLISDQSQVVVWQIAESGEREVSHSILNSFHSESKSLHFQLNDPTKVQQTLPLYCYSEDGQLIFKTQIKEVRESNFSVDFPDEIKLLEDPEVTQIRSSVGIDLSDIWRVKRLSNNPDIIEPDIMRVKSMAERSTRDQDILNQEFGVSVDEEDKLFADKRESPRARPKDDKWVKVAKFQSNGPGRYRLFDLSRGGMGFIAPNDLDFPKGTDVHIMGFDEFDLDDPLLGKVMSVRPIDESQKEFKIGVKFSEGQD